MLDNSPLDKVVACAASSGLDGSATALRVALLHVRFKEDQPSDDDLARFLWKQCFSYALSRRRRVELQKKLTENLADISALPDIYGKVRDIFISFRREYPSRASEVGEVLAEGQSGTDHVF